MEDLATQTPRAMDTRLLEAVTARDHVLFRKLVEEDPGRLAGVSSQGNTLLHVAAWLGDRYVASFVGERLPQLLAQSNLRGDTALHLAARAGHELVVSSFVERASRDPYLVDALLMARNRNGDTALHGALRNRNEPVVDQLIGACPDLASVVNGSGESPLYMAADMASLEIVRILLDPDSEPSAEGPNGKTALHAAVQRSYDNAQILLERKPELIRKQDSFQSTPLHYAASGGDPTMVGLLLKHDVSVAYMADADGLSPIHVAAAMGHVGAIRELLGVCPECRELVDKKGRNLLHLAVEKKRSEVVRYVLKTPLLKEIINEQDDDGNTALHMATASRSRELVHMLLEDKRVNTNITNRKGFTPLDLASSCAKSYIGLRMYKIRQALVSAGSQLSPQRMDHLTSRTHRNHEEETIRCRAIASNLAIVAVLIATVTFAAAFTLPGGYRNDSGPGQGTAALARRAAFKAFLIADTTAMVCSIVVICLLIHSGSVDHDVRLHSISGSTKLMQVAVGGMVAAFAAGVYVVTAAECAWLAILICVVVCSVPVWVVVSRPTIKPLKQVIRALTRWEKLLLRKDDHKCSKVGCSVNGLNAGFSGEGRINKSGILTFMGFERTIDFETPCASQEPSTKSTATSAERGDPADEC